MRDFLRHLAALLITGLLCLPVTADAQRAGKTFDMMIYPRQRHGFTDARLNRHLRQTMFDFITSAAGERAPAGRSSAAP